MIGAEDDADSGLGRWVFGKVSRYLVNFEGRWRLRPALLPSLVT